MFSAVPFRTTELAAVVLSRWQVLARVAKAGGSPIEIKNDVAIDRPCAAHINGTAAVGRHHGSIERAIHVTAPLVALMPPVECRLPVVPTVIDPPVMFTIGVVTALLNKTSPIWFFVMPVLKGLTVMAPPAKV